MTTESPQNPEVIALTGRLSAEGWTEEVTRALARAAVFDAVFGPAGNVSNAWLRRVWKAANLKHIAKPGPRQRAQGGPASSVPASVAAPAPRLTEEVEYFSGGCGLAFVAAAEAELNCMAPLVEAALAAGQAHADAQVLPEAVPDDSAGRGEHGKFTAEYNSLRHAGTPKGQTDARWATDAEKAALRPLAKLATLTQTPAALGRKMLAMAVSPMLMESRGFDGLVGPAGAWLGVLGGTAYMPATLDKTLTELALLDVAEAMWRAHARTWQRITRPWSGPESSWLCTAAYVDGTADPYWTRAFAKSGKVSRVGRVMPCLTRIGLNSGAGVPLLVETHAGAASLKKRLMPMLAELDAAIGPGAEVGRLTIVDSEVGTAGMMWAIHSQTQRIFITVIKGQVLAGARISGEGPWQAYRERDQVREVEVHLKGKEAPAQGLTFRGVEMRRDDGRHPSTTMFVTNSDASDLATADVAAHYHTRWPRQEQVFRTARNGGGLNHSHGYGGGQVQNIALVSKLDKAGRSLKTAQDRVDQATATRAELATALASASAAARKTTLALADQDLRDAQRQLARRQAEQTQLATTPATIYARDTRRDSIMTCLKVSAMAKVEHILKEYFADTSMEWRTFIEQLVALPVTVRSTVRRRLYQIHANSRHPALMADLAVAVAEVNRRELRCDKQRLVFEVLEAPVADS